MYYSARITVLIHIYYNNSYHDLKSFFVNLKQKDVLIIFKISRDNLDPEAQICKQIATDFPEAIIIETSNNGKDIGGKLAMIDLCFNLNIQTDYYILLHDKKSPHTTFGDIWRDKLFKIIEPENIITIKKIFEQNKKIGIVGAKEFILNEYENSTGNFKTTNDQILKKLIQDYNLNLDSYDYIGGTMFWIRAEIIHAFFSKYSPMDIFTTLESGNVLDNRAGTQTHAWERMLSWIAINQGYKIKGI